MKCPRYTPQTASRPLCGLKTACATWFLALQAAG
jgi:hypothetical protein